MEVILLEHVEKLGKMGDKVTVKNGYARNYLLPQNKALRATEANVAFYEKKKAELEAHNKALFDEASKKAEALQGYSAVLVRQAAETGQLYGSVTIRDIAACSLFGIVYLHSKNVFHRVVEVEHLNCRISSQTTCSFPKRASSRLVTSVWPTS